VLAAVNAVLAPHAERLLDEAKALKAQLAARWHVLQFMFTPANRDDLIGGWPSTSDEVSALEARNAPLAELHEKVWEFLSHVNVHDEGKAAVARWRQVCEQLLRNAEAPLPT